MSSDQWKIGIMACLVVLSVALSGCGGREGPSRGPSSQEPSSVSESAPGDAFAQEEEPAPEEAQEPALEEAPSQEAAGEKGVELVSQELGFAVTLPESLRGRMGQSTVENSGITTLILSYAGETGTANLFSFDVMDTETYEKLKAEGGPMGTQLGISHEGRVVLFTGPQSNPFEMGTADYQALETLPSDLSVVFDTFRFLDEAPEGEEPVA